MKEVGVYRVLDKRAYRGHEQGEVFQALIEPHAERRAIYRGSIEKIGTAIPIPQNYAFPNGWLKEA